MRGEAQRVRGGEVMVRAVDSRLGVTFRDWEGGELGERRGGSGRGQVAAYRAAEDCKGVY